MLMRHENTRFFVTRHSSCCLSGCRGPPGKLHRASILGKASALPLFSTVQQKTEVMPLHSCRAALLCVVVVLSFTSGGCRYPKDMENSLQSIQDGTLHVGVTENPPWVMRQNDIAHGLEPEVIKSLAEQLNAEVQWHWGTESEIIQALEQLQVHLAAGGFRKSSHLQKRVALTKPYLTTENRVGFPSESTLPGELTNVPVATLHLAGLSKQLESKGATPRFVKQLQDQDLPVASTAWRLEAYELLVGPWVLSTEKHVLALPKGENAWMMKVQRHLNGYEGLKERLIALERGATQ